jgi:hypothetical protein
LALPLSHAQAPALAAAASSPPAAAASSSSLAAATADLDRSEALPLLLLRTLAVCLAGCVLAVAAPAVLFALPAGYPSQWDAGGALASVPCPSLPSGRAATTPVPFFFALFSTVSSAAAGAAGAAVTLLVAAALALLFRERALLSSVPRPLAAAPLAPSRSAAAVAAGIAGAARARVLSRLLARGFVGAALLSCGSFAPALTAWVVSAAFSPELASWLVLPTAQTELYDGSCGPCAPGDGGGSGGACAYAFPPLGLLTLSGCGARVLLAILLFFAAQAASDLCAVAGGLAALLLRGRVAALLEAAEAEAAAVAAAPEAATAAHAHAQAQAHAQAHAQPKLASAPPAPAPAPAPGEDSDPA